jgi:Tfp pilus assembly protein PilF
MARARGCVLRAAVAGAIMCWAIVDGVAVAQESAEVTEELGSSYLLARRATGGGSIIETLLFDGRVIVTEIVWPGPDTGTTATGAGPIARTMAGGVTAARGRLANLPPGVAPGFGGTQLTAEIQDGYLILHRIRASGSVTHEVFRDGAKVGVVTEVSSTVGRSPGQNVFAFESGDDRFVVYLTQPDGMRIRATTERGQFSGQVVERAAAIAAAPRPALRPAAIAASPSAAAATPPSQPSIEPPSSSISRVPESAPQRVAKPSAPTERIGLEDPTRQFVPELPQVVPLPRASPTPPLRPTVSAVPIQSPSPSASLYRSEPATSTAVAAVKKDDDTSTAVAGGPTEMAAAQPAARTNTTGRDEPHDKHEGVEVPNGVIEPSAAAAATNGGDAQVIADRRPALGLPSNDAKFYRERGIVSYSSGDFPRAIVDFDKAIQLDPNDAQAYNIRGNAWDEIGAFDRALADYEQAIRIDPNNPAVFHDRAILWQRKGALDRALVDLDRAIRFSFSDANVYCDRGLVWYEKDRHDRAIADFNQAIKLDLNFAAACINRGITLHRRSEFNLAFAAVHPAIRVDPKIFDVNRRTNMRP